MEDPHRLTVVDNGNVDLLDNVNAFKCTPEDQEKISHIANKAARLFPTGSVFNNPREARPAVGEFHMQTCSPWQWKGTAWFGAQRRRLLLLGARERRKHRCQSTNKGRWATLTEPPDHDPAFFPAWKVQSWIHRHCCSRGRKSIWCLVCTVQTRECHKSCMVMTKVLWTI